MIDSHIHADSRSFEDFKNMYIAGIDEAITCAFYPYKISHESVLLNHFDRILNYETKRASENGLKLNVALGIHPTNIIKNYDVLLEKLKELIAKNQIVAIGEIGLEQLTELEIEVFRKQLEIADKTKTKVIIHTPRKNKMEVLKSIKKIVSEEIDSSLVLIDHINPETIEEVINEDFTIGLTVQPKKMEIESAVYILENYGFDKFTLNSDVSYLPSDIFSVPKTIRELKLLGFDTKEINKVAELNAKRFFNL
ncbi:MAG: TatD family hydrolase [Methanobacteriaceae archaeon]